VFNPVTATCGVCGSGCLYPNDFFTIPGGLDVLVGLLSGQIEVSAHMCDGTTQTGWECSCSFASNNTAVATVNPDCVQQATGIGPGATALIGTGAGVPGPHCGEQTLLATCDIQVRPRIDNISPAVGTPGSSESVTVNGAGFGADSFMSASNNGISIVITNIASANQVAATFQTSFSTAAGGYQVTLSSNGQTSNPVTFTVRVPDHLLVISDTGQSLVLGNCAQGAPIVRQITFQVVDSGGNAVGVVPVKENFTSLSNNSCGNGQPQPDGCSNTDGSSSNFTDTISVRCNTTNGSCGYTITDQWQWCPSGGASVTLATLNETVHVDQITVNGNTAGFAAGTAIRP